MRRLGILTRLIFLSFLLCLPLAGIGWFAAGLPGAAGAAAWGLFALGLTAALSERVFLTVYDAQDSLPEGLQDTFDREARARGFTRVPLLWVYEDPRSHALVARSAWGRGALLLSRGLITQLDEASLREVMRQGMRRNTQAGIVFESLCAVLMMGALRFAPRAWAELVIGAEWGTRPDGGGNRLTPGSAIRFLLMLPLARLFAGLGRIAPRKPLSIVQ